MISTRKTRIKKKPGKHLPQRYNKCISFQHAQLQATFTIIKVCCTNPAFATLQHHFVNGSPWAKTIESFPHVLHCLIVTVQRNSLYSNTTFVFCTSNRQIFDADMKKTRQVTKSILGVTISFLESKVNVWRICPARSARSYILYIQYCLD